MERLTIKYDDNYVPKKICTVNSFGEVDDCDGCENYCSEYCDTAENCIGCAIQECFDRLAEYENTELTPEQIKDMDEEYSRMAKELSELKMQLKQNNGMIPVSQKLPNCDKRCFVEVQRVGIKIIFTTILKYKESDGNWYWEDGKPISKKYQVISWQPVNYPEHY